MTQEFKETFVFLDFNGKLTNEQFQNKVFLRVANLHKTNPLVQVNDTVFKGTCDHSMGTNLFFEEMDSPPPPSSAFVKQNPIHLKHIISQTKVIKLKQMRVPPRKANIPDHCKNVKFNWQWDYNELLKRFEEGSLNLKDIIKSEEIWDETSTSNIIKEKEVNEEMEQVIEENVAEETYHKPQTKQCIVEPAISDFDMKILDDILPVKMLEAKYAKLQVLARRPVKRDTSPELVSVCEPMYRNAYEYDNIERQILNPSFIPLSKDIKELNEDTLSSCIDIDRCILYGLIAPSNDFPRKLTNEEKQSLLVLDNFDNLSLPARYYVLKDHLYNLENYISILPKDESHTKDEFGRTPLETLAIYKKLNKALANRIQETRTTENPEFVEQIQDIPSNNM